MPRIERNGSSTTSAPCRASRGTTMFPWKAISRSANDRRTVSRSGATSSDAIAPTLTSARLPHRPRLPLVHPHLPALRRRLLLVVEVVRAAAGEQRVAHVGHAAED